MSDKTGGTGDVSAHNELKLESGVYGGQEIARDLSQLTAELPVASSVDASVLRNYLAIVRGNINWYVTNRRSQERKCYLYFVWVLALVILIPYSCFKIVALAGGSGLTPGIVVVLLTTLITGAVALHQAIALWLLRRNTALEFRRAGLALTRLHRGLVARWCSENSSSDDPDAFAKDATETWRKALTIINAEKDAHFATLSGVNLGIGSVWSTAATTSKVLFENAGRQLSSGIRQGFNRQSADDGHIRNEQVRLVDIMAQIKGLRRQLRKLTLQQDFVADREQLAMLNRKIKRTRLRLTEAEAAATRAEARFSPQRSAG